jgi:hypothetical protein
MSYYYDDEEQYDIEYERAEKEFNELEKMIEGDFDKVEKAKNDIINTIEGSENPFLMMNIDTTDLLNFVYSGNYSAPKRYIPHNGNNINILGPLDIEETLDTYNKQKSKWVICRSIKQQKEYEEKYQKYLEANKDKFEEIQKKKEEELKKKALEEKAKANKHNWTLPAELRGIIPEKKTTRSKAQRRKNRKKAFKVRKENPILPSQKKSGFRVNRSNPLKM